MGYELLSPVQKHLRVDPLLFDVPNHQSAKSLLPLNMTNSGPYSPAALRHASSVGVSPLSFAVISKQGDSTSAKTLKRKCFIAVPDVSWEVLDPEHSNNFRNQKQG